MILVCERMKVPEDEPLFPVAEMSLELISFEINKISLKLKETAERLSELSALIKKYANQINQKNLDVFGMDVKRNGSQEED